MTHGTPGTHAAKQATTIIPIVTVATRDPVAFGLVTSEVRPRGKITGLSFFSPELAAKRIQLLKEALPRIRRVWVVAASIEKYDVQTRLSVIDDIHNLPHSEALVGYVLLAPNLAA